MRARGALLTNSRFGLCEAFKAKRSVFPAAESPLRLNNGHRCCYSSHHLSMKLAITSTRSPRVYPAVFRCIYCGTTGAGLSREHIIPAGLGGGLILLKASCETCREITSAAETTCLRRMYLPYRHYMGMVRHPEDVLPTVPLLLDYDPRTPKYVPLNQHPTMFLVPEFREAPGWLTGKPLTTQWEVGYRVHGGEALHANLRSHALGHRTVGINFDLDAYVRMLAKSAHSFLVAEIGLDAFKSELPALILGRAPELASRLVGSNQSAAYPPEGEDSAHQVAWGPIPYRGQILAGVRICLFAEHGAAACCIIGGAVTCPTLLARCALALPAANP
jgi:hypothetical protein